MPAFTYRAVDAAGRQSKGVVEAPSLVGARKALRERALLPVSVEAARSDARTEPGAAPGFTLFRKKVSARTLATVTRQLSTLIGSDIRIEEALRLVGNQAEAQQTRSLLLDVRGAILDGRSFADALSQHPAAFPGFYRASVAAGEASGKLSDVLEHLADFVEARHRTAQKVQLALLYPALLAVVSISMMSLLLVYVVPDIVKVFVSRGADLPFLTRALIALSEGFQTFGPIVLILLFGTIFFGRRWLKEPANALKLDAFFIAHRPFRGFTRQHNAARFAGSLATLVQSAVPLVDALAAAAAVTPNHFVRAKALRVAERVREGASLQGAMTEAAVFPSMLIAIVAAGEQSGRLGPALGRASTELDRELEAFTATLVALVEPAVLLMMGGLVLLMVLAILLPIINLNNLAGM